MELKAIAGSTLAGSTEGDKVQALISTKELSTRTAKGFAKDQFLALPYMI